MKWEETTGPPGVPGHHTDPTPARDPGTYTEPSPLPGAPGLLPGAPCRTCVSYFIVPWDTEPCSWRWKMM